MLRPSSVDVEDLCTLALLPPVEEQRPAACPCCKQPARPLGKPLGIVGHGTYLRQVLGLLESGRTIVIRVRRHLCRGCSRTISVLPDALLPRRWYTGGSILLALTLTLLLGVPAAEVRSRLGQPGETTGWKTLQRWQRQLLSPLWSWVGAQLGSSTPGLLQGREQRSMLLRRLLSLHSACERSPPSELDRVACALAADTAHTRIESWEMSRDH